MREVRVREGGKMGERRGDSGMEKYKKRGKRRNGG